MNERTLARAVPSSKFGIWRCPSKWRKTRYLRMMKIMDAASVTLSFESPLQPQAAGLIEQLDSYLAQLYPADSNHLLDIAALARDCHFLVARHDGEVVGCGALCVHGRSYAELKRIYVSSVARGSGLGRMIVQQLERRAREAGVASVCLETGIYQREALALFRAQGFVERPPFGGYAPDPMSVFMEKGL